MTGCIVKVWLERSGPEGRDGRFLIVETEMPDFATFCQMVDADRLIGGAVLRTHRSGPEEMTITARRPIAFRGAAVLRCELPTWRYVEGAAHG